MRKPMLRSSILAVALTLCLMAPAFADAQVKTVLIRMVRSAATEVNLRTDIYNGSNTVQRGPVIVKLYVRGNSSEVWRHIHTYPAINKIKVGQHVARDYFIPAHGLDPAFSSGHFEVRAISSLSNGKSWQRISTHDD